MRSIIAEDAPSALPIPTMGPHPRLDWLHYAGDGTTVGGQRIYDPGHTPVVTWLLSEDLQTQ